MADPRLQWRPLQQQQANVAGLLRNANLSFNNAADAAGDILGNYDKGRKAAGDAEAMHRLASLNDEAELDDFLAKGGLSDLNISDEMLANLGKARSDVLGFANDRSIVGDRDGRLATHQANAASIISDRTGRLGIAQSANGRAQDLHGVTMNDHQFRQGRRDELAGLSGNIVDARIEGQTFGKSGRPLSPEKSNNVVEAIQTMRELNYPDHIIEGFLMNYEDESNFDNKVVESVPNVHGTRGKGIYQLTGERRKRFENMFNNDWSIRNQILFQDWELNNTEKGARDLIFSSQNAGEAGANIVNNFLRPASEHANSRSSRYLGQTGFNLGNQRLKPGREALEQALSSSEFLSPSDINSLLDTNDTFVSQGDTAIEKQKAEFQENILAQLTMDAVSNPENDSIADVQKEIQINALNSGEFSDSEALGATLRAESTIANSEGIQTQLNPSIVEDVRFSNIIEATNQDIESALGATPQGRMMRDVGKFRENPTENLVSALGIGSDDEDPGGLGGLLGAESGFDKNDLTNLINSYAQQNRVSPEVAAAAMREAFVRDPLGRNTLANRFPATTVKELIENNLNQKDISTFRDQTRQREQYDQRLRTLNDEVQRLQRQAEKGGNTAAISQRIAEIYTQMGQIRSEANELYRGSTE